MIILSNTTAQTVEPDRAITFDTDILHSGRYECWRNGTGLVSLRNNGIYEIKVSANIDGATADAPAQLAVAVDGAPLLETTMISSSTGVNNVASSTAIRRCDCGFDGITLVNTGTVAITVVNPKLFIKRIA